MGWGFLSSCFRRAGDFHSKLLVSYRPRGPYEKTLFHLLPSTHGLCFHNEIESSYYINCTHVRTGWLQILVFALYLEFYLTEQLIHFCSFKWKVKSYNQNVKTKSIDFVSGFYNKKIYFFKFILDWMATELSESFWILLSKRRFCETCLLNNIFIFRYDILTLRRGYRWKEKWLWKKKLNPNLITGIIQLVEFHAVIPTPNFSKSSSEWWGKYSNGPKASLSNLPLLLRLFLQYGRCLTCTPNSHAHTCIALYCTNEGLTVNVTMPTWRSLSSLVYVGGLHKAGCGLSLAGWIGTSSRFPLS